MVYNSSIHAKGPSGAVCDFDNGITLTGCSIVSPTGGYVKNGDIVNADGTMAKEVIISISNSYDLNNDGKVSTADIQVIINEMKKPQASQNMDYDLNNDGKISTADIQVIINEMKK
jgi:predicted component of type VI protein secretion system